MPKLLERRNWDSWAKDGSRDIFEVAEEKALKMLEAEPTKRLSPDREAKIDHILQQAQVGCDGSI